MTRNKWIVSDSNGNRIGVVTAFDRQRATDQARNLVGPSIGFDLRRMPDEEIENYTESDKF